MDKQTKCKNCGFPYGDHQAGSLNCPVKETPSRTPEEIMRDFKNAQEGYYVDRLHREWRTTVFEVTNE